MRMLNKGQWRLPLTIYAERPLQCLKLSGMAESGIGESVDIRFVIL